jgi:hypothetical protein
MLSPRCPTSDEGEALLMIGLARHQITGSATGARLDSNLRIKQGDRLVVKLFSGTRLLLYWASWKPLRID